jgi:ribokinase
MSKILVIGSSNTDLIANVERFPAAGETVEGSFFLQAMGGKGANQALAAHRLGGEVTFVTCLGNDANGQNTLKYYREEGLDVSFARVVENAPTGTAMILVNKEGENCIIITPGANKYLTPGYVAELSDEIAAAEMIVLQMEIPFETVKKVCELAVKSDTHVLLNVAPARKVDASLLRLVDILVVNETEIELISGESIKETGEKNVIEKLIAMGARTVILTLGGKGCIIKSNDLYAAVPAFRVTPVDTTAAGDTFCGALVAQLSKGRDLLDSVKFASAAAALCVTRMGAQPSIPTEIEVNEFIVADLARANGHIEVETKPII